MRIVQFIDTLDSGGAERMAVNYANALVSQIEFSGLVTTRKEGSLKSEIKTGVGYDFINKRKTIDVLAILRLKKYICTNKIDIIHAHGSSFFAAFLVKLLVPSVKIIYHEHTGKRAFENVKQNLYLVICSLFFSEVVVVNHDLLNWCKKHLFTKKVTFLPNFVAAGLPSEKSTTLKGAAGKRIVMIANLHEPKNHLFAVQGFLEMNLRATGWTLHIVGKIFHDDYYNDIINMIKSHRAENQVYFYGICSDVNNILSQADIGILSSTHEGFPVVILEYALNRVAVVSTHVGFCSQIIQPNTTGFLFDPTNLVDFKTQLEKCIFDNGKRLQLAKSLHEFCKDRFSESTVINQLVVSYKHILK